MRCASSAVSSPYQETGYVNYGKSIINSLFRQKNDQTWHLRDFLALHIIPSI